MEKKKISDNLTMKNFIYSRVAIERGLNNMPTPWAERAINNLVENLLQPLQNFAGETIYITSGYRCPEVNRLVRGARNSQHVTGEAADCYVPGGPGLLWELEVSELDFDQAIMYYDKEVLHLSLKLEGENRHEIKEFGKPRY